MIDCKMSAQATIDLAFAKGQTPSAEKDDVNGTSLAHMVWMNEQIQSGLVTGEKAHRWLGWMQGVFTMHGLVDIHEMKQVSLSASGDEWEQLWLVEPILQFFSWKHLPDHLQEISRPFEDAARRIVSTLPRNPERTVALRKLLEAKDAAVRTVLYTVL